MWVYCGTNEYSHEIFSWWFWSALDYTRSSCLASFITPPTCKCLAASRGCVVCAVCTRRGCAAIIDVLHAFYHDFLAGGSKASHFHKTSMLLLSNRLNKVPCRGSAFLQLAERSCLLYLAQLCVGRGNRNKEVGDGMQGGSRTLCCIQKIGPLRSKHVLFCFSECRNVLLCAALFQIPRIVENLTPFPILFKSLFDLNAFFFPSFAVVYCQPLAHYS